jgi:REP element-mobilizing transposase RayT
MADTCPNAQIHCTFSTMERRGLFPDVLRERICLYLIGIGHNQCLPILRARATVHYVHMLISVPRDVTTANAMQLLKGEFLTLAAHTPIRFRLAGQLQQGQSKCIQACSGQTLLRLSARGSRKALVRM